MSQAKSMRPKIDTGQVWRNRKGQYIWLVSHLKAKRGTTRIRVISLGDGDTYIINESGNAVDGPVTLGFTTWGMTDSVAELRLTTFLGYIATPRFYPNDAGGLPRINNATHAQRIQSALHTMTAPGETVLPAWRNDFDSSMYEWEECSTGK